MKPIEKSKMRQAPSTRAPVLAVLLLTVATGCSSDIFDINVVLTSKVFPIEFGSATGTIPTLPCDPMGLAVCGGNQVIALGGGTDPVDVHVALNAACDPGTLLCYAEANARATYTVDVLRDESFTSKVGRRAVSVVRMLDMAYTIPTNTTTFDIPPIAVHVGPPGTTTVGDPGTFLVDNMPPLAAGTVVAAEPRHFVLADDSPARDLIERQIQNKSPFVFLMTVAPRLESGSPVPAGKVEIAIRPVLGLGIR